MYSIYADGLCVYNDTYPLESYKVSSPNLKMADSAAGSLEMVLPPTNVGYDVLRRMKSTLIVKRYDEEIWEGRIVEDSYNFYNERSVYCEGALAYFNDTCQPQREYRDTTLEIFLQSVIDIHNSKVAENRRIYYDYQNVTSEIISYRVTQYQKTMETLNDVCTDYDCHMRLIRRTVNVNDDPNGEPIYQTRKYIQFFKGPIDTSLQTVEFGKNLLDYTSDYNMSELATVILPLGAVKASAGSNGIGDAVDLNERKDSTGHYPVHYDKDGNLLWQIITPKREGVIIDKDFNWRESPDLKGYYYAEIRVKASTSEKTNTVYISCRQHNANLMYHIRTDDGSISSVESKFAGENIGFTDLVESALEMPVSEGVDDQGRKAAGTYRLEILSFGGDIQMRVNMQVDSDESLDEYYTAEDAMISTVNVLSTVPTFTNGGISDSYGSIGNNINDGDSKTIRTNNWFGTGTGDFAPATYVLNCSSTTENVVQVQVFRQSQSYPAVYDPWQNVPARFTVTRTSRDQVKLLFRYANGDDILPEQITNLTISTGEKYGSLYVTAKSNNLFDDVLERGSIISEGDLIGQDLTSVDLTQLRSAKKLGYLNDDAEYVGFGPGQYLLSGNVLKLDANDTRVLLARTFHYDADSEEFKAVDDWSTLPMQVIIPDGENPEKLRFAFKYEDNSNIGLTAISEIMFEQGVTSPSFYEPANTSLIEYGWIEKCITWDDIENPDQLYYRAKSYLASGQFDHMTLDINALDLGTLGADVDALGINQYIRVISPPHGLDRYFEITELDIPLAEPENMTFKLGAETEQTLTSINNNLNDELLAKIDAQGSRSSLLVAAKKEAGQIVMDGFSNGYMITILDDDDHPSGLGFFRAYNSETNTWDPINDIPDVHWTTILNSPDYAHIRCLLISTEGVLFYPEGIAEEASIALVNGKGQIVADQILSGSMLADYIKGGTLTLGYWMLENGRSVDGDLKVLNADFDPTIHEALGDLTDTWSNQNVIINRNQGVVQQGRNQVDRQYRQVRMTDGFLHGSVYRETSPNYWEWKDGGYIHMATVYGDEYGMEIAAPYGPLTLTTSKILLKTSADPTATIQEAYTGQIKFISYINVDFDNGTANWTESYLNFTNGICTGWS